MIVHEAWIPRLLASPAFGRSRAAAATMVDDPAALQWLLGAVDRHRFRAGSLSDVKGGVDLDIACAVVEAHVEELLEQETGVLRTRPSWRERARQRLVVAALYFLVMEDDVVPGQTTYDPVDDVAVLRWLTRVTRGELPAY